MSLARKRPESVAADMPAALRTINKLLSMFGYKPLKSRQRGMDTLNQKQRNCLGFQVSPVPWSGTSNSFHQGHKVRRVTHLDGHPANNGPRRFRSHSRALRWRFDIFVWSVSDLNGRVQADPRRAADKYHV